MLIEEHVFISSITFQFECPNGQVVGNIEKFEEDIMFGDLGRGLRQMDWSVLDIQKINGGRTITVEIEPYVGPDEIHKIWARCVQAFERNLL